MKRHQRGVGSIVLAAVAVLVGLMFFGSLLKLMLAAGAVFVVWKLFFDREPAAERVVAAPTLDLLTPPLDLEPPGRDAELAELDRELERAIQAANAQPKLPATAGQRG